MVVKDDKVSEMDYIMKLKYFNIFLNALYMLRDPKENFISFSIKPAFFGEHINFIDVMLHQKARIQLKISRRIYENIIEDIRHRLPENLKKEIPGADYLRNALLMSHILKPKNWNVLLDEIRKGSARNPLNGEKLILFALDTNIFRAGYSRFICNHLAKIKGTPVGVILPGGVRDEIFYKIKSQKYNKEDCTLLCKVFGGKFYHNVYFNQLMLKSRLWRNASVELRALEKQLFVREVPCRRGDDNIIKALTEITKFDVILITEDDVMVDRARLHKIRAIRLDPPPINEIWNLSGSYSWDLLNELIYSLSIIYGGIKIQYGSKVIAYIFGIWAGKKGENWNFRELKIRLKYNLLRERFNLLNRVPLNLL